MSVQTYVKRIVVFVVLVLMSSCQAQPAELAATVTPGPTLTPEPIVPTRTPVSTPVTTAATDAPAETPPSSTATEIATAFQATLEPTVTITVDQDIHPDFHRFGVAGGIGSGALAYELGLPFSALLNWNVELDYMSDDYEFWQMVRLYEDGIRKTNWDQIEEAIAIYPGSNWLIGNEPDVKWQDNVTPERYAEIYHEVYTFIKERDSEAKVVIGGVSQPTQLRRDYLDIVLNTYQELYGEPMPIDIWNVHAFTLREEEGGWGVDIPPGMDGAQGELYEIEDHNDLEILRQNLVDFRAWMFERGYGDKPLVISEYGILMPVVYGFPPEIVSEFLIGTFELFLSETNETGYAEDENRLVQQWFWYNVHDPDLYPTGNLISLSERRLTPLGEVWASYVNEMISKP